MPEILHLSTVRLRACRALAFEYSTVDAQIVNTVDSVLNPSGGIIRADKIGKLILEKDKVDPGKTTIICTEDEGEGQRS